MLRLPDTDESFGLLQSRTCAVEQLGRSGAVHGWKTETGNVVLCLRVVFLVAKIMPLVTLC